MKLQFRHQKFQADAAKAVCDVFAGQPCRTPSYMIDKDYSAGEQAMLSGAGDFTGFGNALITPELNDGLILEHIQKIQRSYQIEPSKILEGGGGGR
jgi:type III restriction enzyme